VHLRWAAAGDRRRDRSAESQSQRRCQNLNRTKAGTTASNAAYDVIVCRLLRPCVSTYTSHRILHLIAALIFDLAALDGPRLVVAGLHLKQLETVPVLPDLQTELFYALPIERVGGAMVLDQLVDALGYFLLEDPLEA
jgi:hypothetical protein